MMQTKRQEDLINSYLSAIEDEIRPIYHEIINCLVELGYNPKKEKSNISFKHSMHNKQIAKMGIKENKGISPFFALRFSACNEYSKRFTDIVSAAIVKYPKKVPNCINNNCNYCAGEPDTHVYTHMFPNGENKSHCGAYALEIPDITEDDLGEIKKLIKEEHNYLLEHEANRK